jgi:cell division protein FtsZ
MNPESPLPPAVETPRQDVAVKVFGLGNAGINVLERLLRGGVPGAARVGFIAVNSDAASLASSTAPEKLHLEAKLLRGLGTGGDPDRGRALAEENFSKLKALCEGAEVVVILAGLGGGAGTGIGPVLARAARETGALVLGFVVTPFACEGSRRQQLAAHGLGELKSAADGVVCLPNQTVFKLIDENTGISETFARINDLLADGIRGVFRLLRHSGLLEIRFADLCGLLRDRHAESSFAVAEASGPGRVGEVVQKLLAHPMLEDGQMLAESEAVLVSLLGGPDLTMAAINQVMMEVNRQCPVAQVMMGAAIDEQFRDRIEVTLVASRKAPVEAEERPKAGSEEFDTQLLPRTGPPRPSSRFLPPPPAVSPDQMRQMLAKQGRPGSRPRKAPVKMRQTQLPLEIVTKGRFDKSEPTIHKGEDLDVPTYVRRGVALN